MKSHAVFHGILFLLLLMQPGTVQGEFVFSIGGWTVVGGNSAHLEGTRNLFYEPHLVEGSSDGNAQSLGLDLGLTWWFARFPMFGVGLDIDPSSVMFGNSRMSMISLTPCLMLRFPLGKSRAFRYGRLFPYVGMGLGLGTLDGKATIFPETEEEYHLGSPVLLGKVGLEAIIVGGLSVFVEARYMMYAFKQDTTDKTYWTLIGLFVPYEIGRDETHLSASFGHGQISIGIALHLGK